MLPRPRGARACRTPALAAAPASLVLVGAWGEGPFDNDDASDLAGDLSGQPPSEAPAALAEVLAQVAGVQGYIEAPEMSRALAAAAVVAISVQGSLAGPASLDARWRAGLEHPSSALAAAAAVVLARALEPADNEWHELWADAGLLDDARAALAPYAAALDAAL